VEFAQATLLYTLTIWTYFSNKVNSFTNIRLLQLINKLL